MDDLVKPNLSRKRLSEMTSCEANTREHTDNDNSGGLLRVYQKAGIIKGSTTVHDHSPMPSIRCKLTT